MLKNDDFTTGNLFVSSKLLKTYWYRFIKTNN